MRSDQPVLVQNKGTQKTLSLNICSEDLLSPSILGLISVMKNWSIFSSNFHDMGKVMPVVFGEINMSFWIRETGQLAFSERQQQLVNSGNNIPFPRIF